MLIIEVNFISKTVVSRPLNLDDKLYEIFLAAAVN